jgi:para-nitrobenzyl esterase
MQTSRSTICAVAILALGCASSTIERTGPDANGHVRTHNGILAGTGTIEAGVHAWLGVPFAAPPVGNLRWRPPQSAAGWSGVRTADHFAPACMQPAPAAFGPWTLEFLLRGPVSEDCLYLNVWAPTSAPAPRPVFVYIYGGGFGSGSADVPVYDGAHLAAKGLVVVTINYRVGALGFLAHPELTAESPDHASGNYGLLDQVAALQWVRDNIGAFGGHPSRVTIAGQSAGAMSVFLLTTSPRARGLFSRAVIESGPGGLAAMGVPTARSTTRPRAAAEQDGVAYAEALGAKSLAELRGLPASAFVAAPGQRGPGFGPVVDGLVLTEEPPEVIAAGRQNDVPTLTGMNADEASAFGHYDKRNAADSRDAGVVGITTLLLERARTAHTPAFAYYFDHEIPWPEHPEFGAFHTSEVPYVFGTLDQLRRPWTDVDRRLSATMMSYWANFATTGDPNGAGLPQWPAFTATNPVLLDIGDTIAPHPQLSAERFKEFSH